MKTKPLLSTAAVLTCCALTLHPVLAAPNIGVLLEYYEVEQSVLPSMLRNYQNSPDASALLKQVQEMESNGEARLVESSYSISIPSQRNKVESVREHIYPTEYDPPEVPQTLTGPIDPKTVITTPTNPTAYDIRNVGNTFEFEGHIVDGFAFLKIAPELVTFQGNINWSQGIATAQQPLFDVAKTQSQFTVRFGGSELFGTFRPAGPTSSKRLLGFISPTRLEGSGEKAEAVGIDENTQISIITEHIEVDAASAASFARELHASVDATAIRQRLDKTIADGKARLLETTTILTKQGKRAKSTSVREFIYPTEFDPAEIPQTLTGPIDPGLNMITPAGPTAFDVRELGAIVELEPSAQPDDRGNTVISLSIASELVRLAGELTYSNGTNESRQPLFETMKVATNVRLPDGASILLGMHSLETARAGKSSNDEERAAVRNRRVLVFVSAKVKTVE